MCWIIRNFYTAYNRGRTSINFKEEIGMNSFRKFCLKALGYAGSLTAMSLIIGGINTFIDSSEEKERKERLGINEEDSTTNKDEA